MARLHTPREVLAELSRASNRPWWIDKFMKDMAIQLQATLFNGRPVIDIPMSEAACEAVLEEALEKVQAPATSDPLADMLRHYRNKGLVH